MCPDGRAEFYQLTPTRSEWRRSDGLQNLSIVFLVSNFVLRISNFETRGGGRTATGCGQRRRYEDISMSSSTESSEPKNSSSNFG